MALDKKIDLLQEPKDDTDMDIGNDFMPTPMGVSANYIWDQMYKRWLNSGQSIDDFLRERDINPKGAIARAKTKDWLERNELTEPKVDKELDQLKKTVELSSKSKDKTITEIWQLVQGWRKNQAEVDYKMADTIRLHLKILLRNSLVKTTVNGKDELRTILKAGDLLSIARVAETLQKIQRLAVGLSTENVGIDHQIEVQNDDNVPVFEVQMTKNGRFVNIR